MQWAQHSRLWVSIVRKSAPNRHVTFGVFVIKLTIFWHSLSILKASVMSYPLFSRARHSVKHRINDKNSLLNWIKLLSFLRQICLLSHQLESRTAPPSLFRDITLLARHWARQIVGVQYICLSVIPHTQRRLLQTLTTSALESVA